MKWYKQRLNHKIQHLPFSFIARKALHSSRYASVFRKCYRQGGPGSSPLPGIQEGWFWDFSLKDRLVPLAGAMGSITWCCFSLANDTFLYSSLLSVKRGNSPGSHDWVFLGSSKITCEAKHLRSIKSVATLNLAFQILLFSVIRKKD